MVQIPEYFHEYYGVNEEWENVSTKASETIPENFDYSKLNKFGWAATITTKVLPTEVLSEYKDKLSKGEWVLVSKFQPLTEKQMNIFADYLDWRVMSAHQTFSAEIIKKFADKVDFEILAHYQPQLKEAV